MNQIRTPTDIKRLGRIVSVWAHPDDESFLAAGVLAQAVENGQHVVCITATKGEAGVQDESRWPAKDLGTIRAHEMAAALKILGITQHYWLDYHDGECASCSARQAAGRLAAILQKEKPDTILTFGPDGWTGHPDHQTVSHWTDQALKQLGKPIPVYHVIHTPEHYKRYLRPVDEKVNIFFHIDKPPLAAKDECDIYFELPPRIRTKKYKALAAAPSQTSAIFKLFELELLEGVWASECFVRAVIPASEPESS